MKERIRQMAKGSQEVVGDPNLNNPQSHQLLNEMGQSTMSDKSLVAGTSESSEPIKKPKINVKHIIIAIVIIVVIIFIVMKNK